MTEYLDRAGLTEYLEELGFNLVGYGCTTCIGNSRAAAAGDLQASSTTRDLAVVSVLSGNRNFEGRINPDVKMNYLASPPLCVAYALAGTMDIDLYDEPLGEDSARQRRLPQGHLARLDARSPRSVERGGPVGHVPQELWRGVRRRRALELARGPDRRRVRVGRALDLRAPARRSSRTCRASPSRSRTSSTPACWRCSVTASPPTTSPPPASIKRDGPAAQYLNDQPRRVSATSTPTARGAATTR